MLKIHHIVNDDRIVEPRMVPTSDAADDRIETFGKFGSRGLKNRKIFLRPGQAIGIPETAIGLKSYIMISIYTHKGFHLHGVLVRESLDLVVRRIFINIPKTKKKKAAAPPFKATVQILAIIIRTRKFIIMKMHIKNGKLLGSNLHYPVGKVLHRFHACFWAT